ncbi:anti-sigma factor [Paractinoplanes hotanensis]|uniref:Anti-sigma factor n=1 Tax=Paractinoplanes hotanensis TaxID=2906497 RepID=A0ABT0Y4Y8_9ACTN|nr:anti-sigma factor [Actinoplanes hotanensis]MCM4081099.1 anti-sigma factor [Actinoplanes hotanensis]
MNAGPPRGGDTPDEGLVALLAARLDSEADRPRAPVAPLPEDLGEDTEGTDDDARPAPEQDADPTAETTATEPATVEPAAEALLLAVGEELRSEATWNGPPPSLRDSILAAARARTAPVTADAAPAPAPAAEATPEATPDPVPDPVAEPVAAPEPIDRRRPWWRPERWFPQVPRLTWAIPAAVVAAAVFTFGVLAVDRALVPGPSQGEPFAAAGTSLAPDATAKGSIVAEPGGFSITLEPEKLPAAAPGSYYAAWLSGPGGKVPIGSFHWRRTGAPIKLWSGVDPAAYPILSVTLQAEGNPPDPSTLVVMTARIPG